MKMLSKLVLLACCCLSITTLGKKYNEKNIHQLIKQYVSANPIVIEAGAHFGTDTLIMSRLWPEGKIYAFEAYDKNFAKLQNTVKNQQNIIAINLALSNKTGTTEFFPCPTSPGTSSTLAPTQQHPALHKYDKEPQIINCITLDDFIEKETIENIDFMWLDLEGAEKIVLEGSPIALSKTQVIYLEANCQSFWKDIPLYKEIKEFMTRSGFELVYEYFIDRAKNARQANILFVRR